MLTVIEFVGESFGIQASVADGLLKLQLTGTGDMVAVNPLKERLVQVRDDMSRLGLKAVQIDIRALYLLNSSCIKALVRFIYLAQTEEPSFAIEFLVDDHLTWQARALAALERMAPRLVTVKRA